MSENTIQYRDTKYQIIQHRGAEFAYFSYIRGLLSAGEELHIPTEYGRSVVLYLGDLNSVFPEVRRIYIPKEIKNVIARNTLFPNLESIIVDPDNEHIKGIGPMLVIDGELKYVFSAGNRETCIVPECIRKIGHLAFSGTTCKKIQFENAEIDYYDNSFDESEWIKQDYCMINDLLFRCNDKGKVLRIPENTTRFEANLFKDNARKHYASIVSPIPLPKELLLNQSGSLIYAIYCAESYTIQNCEADIALDAIKQMKLLQRIDIVNHTPNSTCRTVDGILYSADMKHILLYPPRNDNKRYAVPDGVEVFDSTGFSWKNDYGYYGEFYGCPIEELVLPGTIRSIDFEYLKTFLYLQSVEIRAGNIDGAYKSVDGAIYTGDMEELLLFPVHKRIRRFVVPDGVEFLDNRAFVRDPGITDLVLPSTLKYIDIELLYKFKKLCHIEIQGDSPNCAFCARDGVLFRRDMKRLLYYPSQKPDEEYDVPQEVAIIDECAFLDNCHITCIHLPDAIQSIKREAFSGCYHLKHINFPAQFESIPDELFLGCQNLEFTLSDKVKRIGNKSLHSWRRDEIALHEGLESLGDYGINEYIHILSFPKSLKEIGKHSFKSLKRISVFEGTAKGLMRVLAHSEDFCHPCLEIIRNDETRFYFTVGNMISAQAWSKLDKLWDSGHFDIKEAEAICFNGYSDRNYKRTVAIQKYREPDAIPVYRAFLRQSTPAHAKRLLLAKQEDKFIETLKLDVMTVNALRELLQIASRLEMATSIAYIMEYINRNDAKSHNYSL